MNAPPSKTVSFQPRNRLGIVLIAALALFVPFAGQTALLRQQVAPVQDVIDFDEIAGRIRTVTIDGNRIAPGITLRQLRRVVRNLAVEVEAGGTIASTRRGWDDYFFYFAGTGDSAKLTDFDVTAGY